MTRLSVDEKAGYMGVMNITELKRPKDIDETLHPDFKENPAFAEPLSALHRFAWSRGLTEMRAYQADWSLSKIAARIVMGGKFGPTKTNSPEIDENSWYMGRMPGVLEEVLLSAEAKQPVFLIGAFGGAARLTFDLVRGTNRPEATWAYHQNAPYAAEVKALYEQRGLEWPDYDAVAKSLCDNGHAGLNPLLSEPEQLQLADSVDPLEIAELVLSGLAKL